MTTPGSESGASERGRRRDGYPQGDRYWDDDQLYDDTGWHPDLSDAPDREGPPDRRRHRDQADPGDASFRSQRGYEGNGAYPGERRRAGEGPSTADSAGRHARQPRDGQGLPGRPPRSQPPRQPPDQRGYYQPERHRDYPGYPEPRRESQPYSEPGYGGRPVPPPDRPVYPEAQRDYWNRPAAPPPPGYQEPRREEYPQPPRADYRGPRDPSSRRDYDNQLPPRDDRRGPAPSDRGGYRRPADGYLSMSDPAAVSDQRRGGGPVYDEDLPGQPAFMRHRDPPPIYVDLPSQPYTEQTRILPALWGSPLTAEAGAPASAEVDDAAGPVTGSYSIAKSSSGMAVGTLVSRATGFVRTLIQAYALGTLALSVAYNNANTLPNVVYNLALGGILTSVIVPLIVNARRRESDRGEAYTQRMFTMITAALLGITLVATIAAAPLIDLYKGNISGPTLHLMVIFAYFMIPQIFFYGMSSLISAVLNSRGSFAAPMWTPVINNVVVIIVLLLYMVTAGPAMALSNSPHLTSGEVKLVGLGTTLGIVAQTVALIPAMRKIGFRWRPRWDFNRSEVSEIGHMGGWMFCYIAATQIAFAVTTIVFNTAQRDTGATAYTYAWQLFQLPYAVVGISVITALLPRMSAHASAGRFRMVRSDFSSGVRLGAVIVVPCSLILAALGPDLGLIFLDHGRAGGGGTSAHTTAAEAARSAADAASRADYIGVVFAVFCLGLLPYMLFQLQLRVFYSLHDSKTPALIGVATMALNIVANLIVLNVVPSHDVVAGLGVGFGLANLLGTFLAWRILSRRLRGLDGRTISGALVKMHAAAIPGALFAVTIGMMVTASVAGGRTGAAITVVVGGGGALLLYLLFAKALRVSELTSVTRTVMSRFGR